MIPLYLVCAVLSTLFLTGVTAAISIGEASSSGLVSTTWKYALGVAAVAALLGALAPSRYRLIARAVEAVGAGVLAVEVAVYVGAILANYTIGQLPWATVLFASGLAGACAVRSVKALVERGRLLAVAAELGHDRNGAS